MTAGHGIAPEFCRWVKTSIHVELAGEVKAWGPIQRAQI